MTIEHYRGDSKTCDLTVTDSEGSAFNLTDAAIWFTVKRDPRDTDAKAIITKATANVDGGADSQILITDGAAGEAEIYLLPADTEGLEIPSYDLHYGVQVKTAAGKVYTVARGSFRLVSDITRSRETS